MRPAPILPPPVQRKTRARRSWLLSLLTYAFAAGGVLFLCATAVAGYYVWAASHDLPDYERLAKYEPPVMTRIHAADGTLMAEYAKERRIFVPINVIPQVVIQAFLAAEDRRFYEHGGIDFKGVVRAALKYVQTGGKVAQGASTITQQVAKNLLLNFDRTFDRKLKEAILAIRMERTFEKPKILELYLNEIYLGMNSYGVAAAALNYFSKELAQLTLEEAAYLAALPKGPGNYHPFRRKADATGRRNWVLDQMADNGFITVEQARAAKAKPLTVNIRPFGTQIYAADYFAEEVRRKLLEMYGEDGLYGSTERTGSGKEVNGGLSVRTTLDVKLQKIARRVLIDGLVAFDREKGGWRGAYNNKRIEVAGDWGTPLSQIDIPTDPAAVAARRGVECGQEQGQGRPAAEARPGRQSPHRARGGRDRLRRGEVGQGQRQDAQGGHRRAEPRRRCLGGAEEPGPARRGLVAHADPRGGRRAHRPRSAHGQGARRGRRLLVLPESIRPRAAGQASAGLLLQAVRLRRGARQRLQIDQHRARRADRDRPGPGQGGLDAQRTTTGSHPTGRRPCVSG